MPYKCSVYGCSINYDAKKGEVQNERKRTWIKCLLNANFKYTHSKRLCDKHWPVGYTKIINRNGVLGPTLPPSIFEGIPPSSMPTQPAKKGESVSSRGWRGSGWRGSEPAQSSYVLHDLHLILATSTGVIFYYTMKYTKKYWNLFCEESVCYKE